MYCLLEKFNNSFLIVAKLVASFDIVCFYINRNLLTASTHKKITYKITILIFLSTQTDNNVHFPCIVFLKNKLYGPFLMDGFQLPQGYTANTRRQFTFYHQVPRNCWYSYNRLQEDKRLSQP